MNDIGSLLATLGEGECASPFKYTGGGVKGEATPDSGTVELS